MKSGAARGVWPSVAYAQYQMVKSLTVRFERVRLDTLGVLTIFVVGALGCFVKVDAFLAIAFIPGLDLKRDPLRKDAFALGLPGQVVWRANIGPRTSAVGLCDSSVGLQCF